jgi:hypothetical protein
MAPCDQERRVLPPEAGPRDTEEYSSSRRDKSWNQDERQQRPCALERPPFPDFVNISPEPDGNQTGPTPLRENKRHRTVPVRRSGEASMTKQKRALEDPEKEIAEQLKNQLHQ